MNEFPKKEGFLGEGLIFVGGAPRSGTTLVQRILNAHPSIYGGAEFDFIPQILAQREQMIHKIERGRISNILSIEEANDAYRSFIQQLLYPKRNREGVSWMSEKTPANAIAFEGLVELLPEARFVLCLRNPRAIVASMKAVAQRAKESGEIPDGFVRSIKSSVDYINSCWQNGLRGIAGSNYASIVYYEDLVSEPEKTVASMLEELGIDYDSSAIDLAESKFEVSEDRNSWKNWYTDELFSGSISRDSLDKWKSNISTREADYIAHSVLIPDESIGQRYSLTGDAPSLLHPVLLDHYIKDAVFFFRKAKAKLSNR